MRAPLWIQNSKHWKSSILRRNNPTPGRYGRKRNPNWNSNSSHSLDYGTNMEYIKKIRKLSEGSSSIVYKCENLVTKKSIATKEIKQQIADEGIPAQILR